MDSLLPILTSKNSFSIKAQGNSMLPTFIPNDIIYIKKVSSNQIQIDDIVLIKSKKKWFIHRIIDIRNGSVIITKGDNSLTPDKPISMNEILGKVYSFNRDNITYRIQQEYKNQSSIYLREITKFVKISKEDHVDYVFIDGWPLHLIHCKRYPLRIYADCEILTNPSNYNSINSFFENDRYIKIKETPSKQIFSKSFNNFAVTFYINYKINILYNQYGLLKKLFLQKKFLGIETILLKEKDYVKFDNQLFPILSSSNLIVYHCLNFFHYNFKELYRLRIINEVLNTYLSKDTDLAIDELSKKIIKLNIQNLVYPTFILLKKYYKVKIPHNLLIALKPHKTTQKYMHRAIINSDISTTELGLKLTLNRFKNLFTLSPLSIYARILFILQILLWEIPYIKIENRLHDLLRNKTGI